MASSGTTSNTMRFTGAQLVVHLLERRYHYGQRHSGRLHPAYLRCLEPKHADPPHPARHEQGRVLSLRGWRVPKVNPRSAWPVAAWCHQPDYRHRRCPPRFYSAGLHHRAGSGLNDRHRRLPEVDTYGISIPITKHNRCAISPSCRR